MYDVNARMSAFGTPAQALTGLRPVEIAAPTAVALDAAGADKARPGSDVLGLRPIPKAARLRAVSADRDRTTRLAPHLEGDLTPQLLGLEAI